MTYIDMARSIATDISSCNEELLVSGFVSICRFLELHPEKLSIKATRAEANEGFIPSVHERTSLLKMATKHFNGYRNVNIPSEPSTIPDNAVSTVLQMTYGYTEEQTNRIKIEHQHSMSAENCVGSLLERYIDSILKHHGWVWCCGDFVRAIDFIKENADGSWTALQIKNRNNSENSSSSAIRNGTTIDKWFRSFSTDTRTSRDLNYVNWNNLPESMQNYGLSENGFLTFIRNYISSNIN